MKKSLPPRPNLPHLRKQAKKLLSDLKAGNRAAVRTFIEHLPAAKAMTPAQVATAGFRLADAQSAVARKAGFGAWPALARHVAQLRALEGEWRFTALEIDGAPMSSTMLGSSRLLIDGDRFRTEGPDGVYDGEFTIEVEADPPHIDIEFVEGPEAGNWSYGIYRLEGDELLLCLGLAGSSRPARFGTAEGSGHALERLRRISPDRPAAVSGGQRRAVPAETRPRADEAAFQLTMTALLEQMQGEWRPVALVTDGKALPESMLAFGARTMKANETKVVFGGQVMLHAKVRLDESQSPIAVDYLNVGRGPAIVTLGILELNGDLMRVCMASPGAARPREFSSERGSGRTLSEWVRKRVR
jgi:uncharacterized protein (TIGR03067 family)